MKIINFFGIVYLIFLVGCSKEPLNKAQQTKPENHKKISIQEQNTPSNVIQITTEDELISQLQNNKKTSIYFFFMDSCGWCTMMKPIVQEMAQIYSKSISFYEIDGIRLQAHKHVSTHLNKKVTAYPFFLFLKKGKVTEEQLGGMSKEEFKAKIKKII